MSNYNNSNSWGGPSGTSAGEFRGTDGASGSARHNPFTAGKSGPPVFYRSKAAGGPSTDAPDERETEAPRVSHAPSKSAFLSRKICSLDSVPIKFKLNAQRKLW